MHYSVGGRFLDESRRICDGAPFLPDRSKSMDELGSQHQVGEWQAGGIWGMGGDQQFGPIENGDFP